LLALGHCQRFNQPHAGLRRFGKSHAVHVQLEFAGLKLGQVEHVVNQVAQIAKIGLHTFERHGLPLIERPIVLRVQHLCRHAKGLQGRAQIVADVGQEFIFQTQRQREMFVGGAQLGRLFRHALRERVALGDESLFGQAPPGRVAQVGLTGNDAVAVTALRGIPVDVEMFARLGAQHEFLLDDIFAGQDALKTCLVDRMPFWVDDIQHVQGSDLFGVVAQVLTPGTVDEEEGAVRRHTLHQVVALFDKRGQQLIGFAIGRTHGFHLCLQRREPVACAHFRLVRIRMGHDARTPSAWHTPRWRLPAVPTI